MRLGEHILKVKEISRYGDLINFYEIPINMVNKKYDGKNYIDNPVYNTIFIRPDDSKIEVSGWSVSNDSKEKIKILVDEVEVNGYFFRFERQDVDVLVSPDYGGKILNPKSGFKSTIDISNLDKGKHTIKLQTISRYGDLITESKTEINIENKKYLGKCCIDYPINNSNYIIPDDEIITFSGWAVSEDSNATLRFFVDGNLVENNLNRILREDVDDKVSPNFGGKNTTPNAGFSYQLNVNNFSIGSHIIRLEEVSRYGDLITAQEKVFNIKTKKYLGEMCLDYPTYNSTYEQASNINVAGWAVSQDELAKVNIYIDGNFISEASRYYREDVIYFVNKYDGKTVNAGFGKRISTSGLSVGSHKITVYEISRYGDIIGGVETIFYIQNNNNNNDNNDDNNDIIVIPDKNDDNIKTEGTLGIDVSQHQGNIDWGKVSKSDIKFAMIRIGYRGYATGKLAEDTKFKSNLKESVSKGIKSGVYFYSTALNADEAKKDAEYVINLLDKYGYRNMVGMPIAIDLEVNPGINSRDYNLSKKARTTVANTFCSTIASYGYVPMIYASKSFLTDRMNINEISYDIWVAQYNTRCTYNGIYYMWQNTSKGKVSGISGNVDLDYCYKNY